MANNYTEIKLVREMNGDRFIQDFRRVRTIVALLPAGCFFEIRKQEVWAEARKGKILYRLMTSLYQNDREVMAVTNCM